MVSVTKTFLPPQEEYQAILNKAWDKGWITNRGVLVKELENKLMDILGVSNIIATTNGTLPLQIAIKALKLKGEVITTPFSYVATCSSIVWEGCKPVFVDIHPEYLTIDESKIEESITPATSAILATHVFGNPCEVDKIGQIGKKYDLKVIYDAAHCFGVKYNGKSIFNYGDISTCSFHATKLFHTGEGGAIFSNSEALHDRLFYHHNFGHKGTEDFYGIGINAKMSELQAAMGLSILPYMPQIIQERKRVVDFYDKNLKNLNRLKLRPGTDWNFCYYPIIFKSEEELLKKKGFLEKEGIFPRRYFYPSLNTLNYVEKQQVEITENISSRIMCLPLFGSIKVDILSKICSILNNKLK